MFTLFRVLFLLVLLVLTPIGAQAKMLLTGTSDLVQVITASGVSTIYVHASWADITTSALTPGRTNTQITTATTTTIVGSPGASTQRQVKFINIRNSHASSSNVVTVQHTDGTTVAQLIQYTLLAGETLQWSEDENFRVLDSGGRVKTLAVIYCDDGTGAVVVCIAGPNVAHDAPGGSINPVPMGCYASAAAPSDVSADTDIVRAWCARNGARRVELTYGGVLAATPDPCSTKSKLFIPISQTTSTELFTGTASNRTYICDLFLSQPSASTQTFSLVNGTGSVCGTSTAAMIGATSAANGVQVPFTLGNGLGSIAKSTADAANVCLLQSSTDRLTGVLSYVVATN